MSLLDLERLIEKLARIEALHAGGATPGEKQAAGAARERILERIREAARVDAPVEFVFSMTNPWSRKLLLALLRRYEIKPYRLYRQRHTTVRAKMPPRFCDETLWPEFKALNAELVEQLDRLADEVIRRSIHEDCSDAPEVAGLLEAAAAEPAAGA